MAKVRQRHLPHALLNETERNEDEAGKLVGAGSQLAAPAGERHTTQISKALPSRKQGPLQVSELWTAQGCQDLSKQLSSIHLKHTGDSVFLST